MSEKMEKEKKISIGITAATIALVMIFFAIYFMSLRTAEEEQAKISVQEENIQEQEAVVVIQEQETDSFLYEEELSDIWGKSKQELYEEAFSCTEEESEYVHYYIKGGTLFFDEYAETGSYDEEGLAVYEWKREQKIAEHVIYVDANDYSSTDDAVYITDENQLCGTGKYRDIYLENVKFARAYADQLLALKTDGSLWCMGRSFSLSDGRELFYSGWQQVLTDVTYASLGHYLYMAITEDGSLYMWGDNTYGQFGDGSLLKEDTGFKPDIYFYPEPIKVADGIKMIWQGKPGMQYPLMQEGRGVLQTYFLTETDELYVCGEAVDEEVRIFYYFGELGRVDEGVEINCTSKLYPVKAL